MLFAHHGKVMNQRQDLVETVLMQQLVGIDGKLTQGDRQALCKNFQVEDDRFRVALMSITAAGVELTKTKSKVVVFA